MENRRLVSQSRRDNLWSVPYANDGYAKLQEQFQSKRAKKLPQSSCQQNLKLIHNMYNAPLKKTKKFKKEQLVLDEQCLRKLIQNYVDVNKMEPQPQHVLVPDFCEPKKTIQHYGILENFYKDAQHCFKKVSLKDEEYAYEVFCKQNHKTIKKIRSQQRLDVQEAAKDEDLVAEVDTEPFKAASTSNKKPYSLVELEDKVKRIYEEELRKEIEDMDRKKTNRERNRLIRRRMKNRQAEDNWPHGQGLPAADAGLGESMHHLDVPHARHHFQRTPSAAELQTNGMHGGELPDFNSYRDTNQTPDRNKTKKYEKILEEAGDGLTGHDSMQGHVITGVPKYKNVPTNVPKRKMIAHAPKITEPVASTAMRKPYRIKSSHSRLNDYYFGRSQTELASEEDDTTSLNSNTTISLPTKMVAYKHPYSTAFVNESLESFEKKNVRTFDAYLRIKDMASLMEKKDSEGGIASWNKLLPKESMTKIKIDEKPHILKKQKSRKNAASRSATSNKEIREPLNIANSSSILHEDTTSYIDIDDEPHILNKQKSRKKAAKRSDPSNKEIRESIDIANTMDGAKFTDSANTIDIATTTDVAKSNDIAKTISFTDFANTIDIATIIDIGQIGDVATTTDMAITTNISELSIMDQTNAKNQKTSKPASNLRNTFETGLRKYPIEDYDIYSAIINDLTYPLISPASVSNITHHTKTNSKSPNNEQSLDKPKLVVKRECKCHICQFMNKPKEEDTPLIKEMKVKLRRVELLHYYRNMCQSKIQPKQRESYISSCGEQRQGICTGC